MHPLLRRMASGAAAGAVATVVMTFEMALAKRAGLLGEPPPYKLTRRIFTVLGHRPRGRELHAATAAAHIAYGAAAGMAYAALPPRLRGRATGTAFGVALWAVSYMGWIPKIGLMRSPSRDRPGRPTAMILGHVVFGATLDAALRVAGRRRAAVVDSLPA